MSVMFWIWLGVIVLTLIIEIFTTELISICFTLGAVPPFILAGTTPLAPVWQILIFIALSALMLIFLRKVTRKYLLKGNNEKTNTDLLIGKECTLLGDTDFEKIGKVKINDVEWNAVGADRMKISAGTIVEIVSISGNKLIVKPKNNDTEETK